MTFIPIKTFVETITLLEKMAVNMEFCMWGFEKFTFFDGPGKRERVYPGTLP